MYYFIHYIIYYINQINDYFKEINWPLNPKTSPNYYEISLSGPKSYKNLFKELNQSPIDLS